jgi:putative tricarboxylic transport membrane protein
MQREEEMQLLRRVVLAGVLSLPLTISGSAFAQDSWTPTEDVEFVIPFAVGGGADLLARMIGKVIEEEQLVPVPVTLVNHPGGGGAVGLAYVTANRAADPHTIVLVNGTTQITPILNPEAKTLSEIRPVMNVMLDDFVFFVKGDSRWQTMQDFVAEAQSKPDKTLSFAAGGTTDVMAVTVLSHALGKDMNIVSFNSGGEALTALLGGHVDASIGNPLEFMGHLESGDVRALGVFRDTRFEALPDVPTMKEQGIETPNFQMWRGIAVPKGVDDAAAQYWQGVIEKVVASPTLKTYIEENAATVVPIGGAEFEQFLAHQETLYRGLLDKPAN